MSQASWQDRGGGIPGILFSAKTLVLDLDQTLVHSTLTLMEDADFEIEINVPDVGLRMVYVKVRLYYISAALYDKRCLSS